AADEDGLGLYRRYVMRVLLLMLLLGSVALNGLAQTGEKPDDASYYEASTLYDNGQLEQAENHLNAHLEKWPKDDAAYALRAMVHDELGDTTAALADIEKALSISYYTPEYHRNAGFIKQRMGRLFEAERHFRIYLNKNHNEPAAYEQLAEVLLLQEKYKMAGQTIATGLRVAPKDEWLMVQQVRYWRLETQLDSAKAAGEKLIARYPANAMGHRLMGQTLYELDEAGYCTHFDKAAELGDAKARVLKRAYCEQNQD
ncbi:MAG: tetratricopeptide repeat protein, partial [Bacteroidota bacterium]